MDQSRLRDRLRASAGVAGFHGLLAYALITGFGVGVVRPESDNLKLFDVREPPPPPEISLVEPSPDRAGAAGPSARRARPTPVVAPPRQIPLPSPLPAAPEPAPLPTGSDPSAGAAEVGSGTGAGGRGAGAGSGGEGSGTGGGGGARAQRVSGRLSGATDYPPGARRAGIEGTVAVRYVVGTDGRVRDCALLRSSGNAELDSTTCRLIERRFRYRPARDAHGRPVPEVVSRTFDWMLPFRR
jgi:protein TonB